MNLEKIKHVALVGLMALAIVVFSSAEASSPWINLGEIINLEYPFILYSREKGDSAIKKIKCHNGRFLRTEGDLDLQDPRIQEIKLFLDLDNDGSEEAIVVYNYFHSRLPSITTMFCVVINKNGHPQIADFKHFYGKIELTVKKNIINIIVRSPKLPEGDRYKQEYNFSFQGEKLVEK